MHNDNGIFNIQLQFYIDELEICNPLGSSKTLYKISAVYFTLLNFPLNIRYNRSYIFLCLLFREIFLKQSNDGYQIFFEPLINDLIIFKKGITVKLNIFRTF